MAGLSVASAALPVAVAYAQLAGLNPVVGLYSCILALVRFLKVAARPRDEVPGEGRGVAGIARGGTPPGRSHLAGGS